MLFLLEKRNKVKSPKESITKVICTKKSQISLCFNFLEICKQCRGKLEEVSLVTLPTAEFSTASESVEDPGDVKAEDELSKDLAQVHDIPT